MANSQRGEVSIKLSGETYIMRPSFEALCELEDVLGTTLPQLVIDLQTGNVSLKKVTAVIWSGIWGYNKDKAPSMVEIGEMVVNDGMLNIVNQDLVKDPTVEDAGPIITYLVYGISGNESVEEDQTEDPKE
ncbi:MAG: gene transfer agent family protein [Candidatus Odinarchaeia archaeon]